MFYKKQGFPEDDELVLCTITSVQHHSVFAKLDEYEDKSGMIHISEVSPGRIRNIRDFVVEGKKVVCKVLKIDRQRGHIDLSLRRVNEIQKRSKLDQIKQEQKAEKIIEIVAKKFNKPVEEFYKQVMDHIHKKYEYLYEFFDEIVIDKAKFDSLALDKELLDGLVATVKEKIKLPEVEIKGTISLTSYDPNGVEIIKETIKKTESKSDKINIKYLGAGKYGLIIKAPDYKEAEKILKSAVSAAEKFIDKNNGEFEFEREE